MKLTNTLRCRSQYVVQWVIEKGDPEDRSLVVAKLYGQVLPLAQQKFASNVVEKCVIHGSEEERRRLIDEVLKTTPDGSSIIKAMLTHPYANYVMQSESTFEAFSLPAHPRASIRSLTSSSSRARMPQLRQGRAARRSFRRDGGPAHRPPSLPADAFEAPHGDRKGPVGRTRPQGRAAVAVLADAAAPVRQRRRTGALLSLSVGQVTL